MRVAIIGGGAAGFFAAINIKELNPSIDVTIYEAADEPLAKVRVSGGGRCNLTNSFEGCEQLSRIYPRGERVMRHALKVFTPRQTYEWFESRGVRLTTQPDGCVFPASQSSEEIIGAFLRLTQSLGVKLECGCRVIDITKDRCFTITTNHELHHTIECDVIVATTGGAPTLKGVSYLRNLPLKFVEPCPSLFSLKLQNPITELMGIVVEQVGVTLKGTKHRSSGALLITHWGMSGPAILKLSSHGARTLSERSYRGEILINWVLKYTEEEVRREVVHHVEMNGRKLITTVSPFGITNRLWQHLLQRASIPTERRWAEVGTKGVNRIVATLMGDEYTIEGKSTHTEEFVTCGGVDVKSVDIKTLELKECLGLYLAGELLDVDAITGGFNLQGAWSMAYLVSREIARFLEVSHKNIPIAKKI